MNRADVPRFRRRIHVFLKIFWIPLPCRGTSKWLSFRILLTLITLLFLTTSCSWLGTSKSTYVHPTVAQGKASFKAGKYELAYRQLLPRAVKGNSYAQYAIGYMYYYGKGMDRNEELAENWLRKSAKQGQPEAIALLKKKEE